MRDTNPTVVTPDRRRDVMRIGLMAGLAGGLAEILWITSYTAGSGVSAAAIARGVAEAVGLRAAGNPALLGIVIHMALAAALGAVIVAVMQALPIPRRGWRTNIALSLAALAGVWAFNFLLLLPALSPEFVTMVPMPVSFASKLLFGLATFAVFQAKLSRGSRSP